MQHRHLAGLALALAAALSACTDGSNAPDPSARISPDHAAVSDSLARVVRQLAAGRGITAMPRLPRVRPALSRLGQALAFDKILSGNRDISCMTCHLPPFATGDGRSLSIGQGAVGLGPARVHPDHRFIPRNAPSLFNLTAMPALFWDGRVSMDARGRFHTPAGAQLTRDMSRVLEFGAASALALFPVLSRDEMRGQSGNELAAIPDSDNRAVWSGLMHRLGAIPAYRRMFEAAYPGTPFRRLTFAHAANAIGGFLVDRFSFSNSPWDRFLAGNNHALSAEQLAGAQVFLTIRCSLCHNGPAFTDNKFHDVALAQFGPGEGNGPDGHDDFGRMNVTGQATDRYAFRTTPLRNVVLTAPYGHDGAFPSLREFIDHYSESDVKLRTFDPGTLEPLLQGALEGNIEQVLANRDTIIQGVVLPPTVVDQLTDFMTALTDPAARDLSRTIPAEVPSGLPVDGR
jgi:cytochrome c peroxidase